MYRLMIYLIALLKNRCCFIFFFIILVFSLNTTISFASTHSIDSLVRVDLSKNEKKDIQNRIKVYENYNIPNRPFTSFDVNQNNDILLSIWGSYEQGIYLINGKMKNKSHIKWTGIRNYYACWDADGENILIPFYDTRRTYIIDIYGRLIGAYDGIDLDIFLKRESYSDKYKYTSKKSNIPLLPATRIDLFAVLEKEDIKTGEKEILHDGSQKLFIYQIPSMIFVIVISILIGMHIRDILKKRRREENAKEK